MRRLTLIAHNLRSTYNVGSLIRTAEGLGVEKIYLTGYTPYPKQINDNRLPHLSTKLDKQIHKTALGAENIIELDQQIEIEPVIESLRSRGYKICALEQAPNSIGLNSFKAPGRIALIVGREVEGIEQSVLKLCDFIIEIPMRGKKESFNVVQAMAIAVYKLLE
jgi:23S rRNA (guanosine2251-2'-O)-methyltransferase